MANQNIEMKHLNGSGTYDTLYPKTLSTNTIISDTIATEMGLESGATVDEALSTLQEKVVKIYKGSYIGNGQGGQEHPNQLSFDFTPKILLISDGGTGKYGVSPYVWGAQQICVSRTLSGDGHALEATTTSDNTITWYHADSIPQFQLNQENYEYYYCAIG